MKEIKPLKNEDGAILVVSLIILALASMIGIAATMTASLELQISGNDMRYAENFYRAEAAAMVGARTIEESTAKLPLGEYSYDNEDIPLPSIPGKGLPPLNIPNPDNISDDANWTTGTDKISADAPDAISDEGYEARFLPVEVPARGASKDLAGASGTSMHEFVVYGRSILEPANSTQRLGEVIIEVGYKKRY